MSAGDDKPKKEGKGFSGLSSLITDVDSGTPPGSEPAPSTPTPAPALSRPAQRPAPPPSNPHTASSPAPQPQAHRPQTAAPGAPSQITKPSSSSNAWWIWLLVIGGVIWAIAASDNKPKAPTRPTEQMPSAGRNNVLSYNELHYCLAEEIRMEGAKSVLNSYSDSDVNRFNTMVGNYNSRCGEFKYRQGALESARRAIEPWRRDIFAEGWVGFSPRASLTPAPRDGGNQSTVAAPSPAIVDPSESVSGEPTGPWAEYASAPSAPVPPPATDPHAEAKAAWESALADWAQRNSSFLADPNRLQAFSTALDQVNKETNGSLSDSDLLTTAYQRAAISTGWLTVIPSTPEGKPIQLPGTNYSGTSTGTTHRSSGGKPINSNSLRCQSGTQWVDEEQQCCERYVYVQSGNYGKDGMRWVGCTSPRTFTQADSAGHARDEAERACSSFREFGKPGDFESCVSSELRKHHR